jgi:hypothetical protein
VGEDLTVGCCGKIAFHGYGVVAMTSTISMGEDNTLKKLGVVGWLVAVPVSVIYLLGALFVVGVVTVVGLGGDVTLIQHSLLRYQIFLVLCSCATGCILALVVSDAAARVRYGKGLVVIWGVAVFGTLALYFVTVYCAVQGVFPGPGLNLELITVVVKPTAGLPWTDFVEKWLANAGMKPLHESIKGVGTMQAIIDASIYADSSLAETVRASNAAWEVIAAKEAAAADVVAKKAAALAVKQMGWSPCIMSGVSYVAGLAKPFAEEISRVFAKLTAEWIYTKVHGAAEVPRGQGPVVNYYFGPAAPGSVNVPPVLPALPPLGGIDVGAPAVPPLDGGAPAVPPLGGIDVGVQVGHPLAGGGVRAVPPLGGIDVGAQVGHPLAGGGAPAVPPLDGGAPAVPPLDGDGV